MRKRNILFIGAHTDDIEISCGGTLLQFLLNKNYDVKCVMFSPCTDLARNQGIEQDQQRVKDYIQGVGGEYTILDFPNKYFYLHSDKIREQLEYHRDTFSPDTVFCHWKSDIHQDHQVIYDEVCRVFRFNTILQYENIKSTPGFLPNFYIPLTLQDVKEKIKLLSMYKTQKDLYYSNPDTIRYVAYYRGLEAGLSYAEGFFSERIIGGTL